MKLFLVLMSIYLGFAAVALFCKAFLESKSKGKNFPAAATMDIMISLIFMVWAIVLLVR